MPIRAEEEGNDPTRFKVLDDDRASLMMAFTVRVSKGSEEILGCCVVEGLEAETRLKTWRASSQEPKRSKLRTGELKVCKIWERKPGRYCVFEERMNEMNMMSCGRKGTGAPCVETVWGLRRKNNQGSDVVFRCPCVSGLQKGWEESLGGVAFQIYERTYGKGLV